MTVFSAFSIRRRFSALVSVLALGTLVVGLMAAAASAQTWRGLQVAPEYRCLPYDADDYRYPQSVEDRITADLGGVYGPYTGRWFASDTETDIEHMVARSEAHDSGLCAADDAQRRAFARDLLNLTLAAPGVNRHQKSDRDAAEWLPQRNRCWFAARVVEVRRKYALTIDRREADALDAVLDLLEVYRGIRGDAADDLVSMMIFDGSGSDHLAMVNTHEWRYPSVEFH